MTCQLLFIGTTELLLIGSIALLLFGGKKLPEMMRGLGQGVREFKKGVKDIEKDIEEKGDMDEQAEKNCDEQLLPSASDTTEHSTEDIGSK